jgi:tRNA threonylcarbamoyladenosine biosynthesis protein TsaE
MKYRNLSLAQVERLAGDLARKTPNTGAIIGLIGNLGSGKTTFAKSFAQQLKIKSLKSPTFIVSQRYNLKDKFLYHIDLYRLDNENQLTPLGLPEILSGKNIVLIEWVDKFPTIAEECDILISFQVKPNDKRDVEVKFN